MADVAAPKEGEIQIDIAKLNGSEADAADALAGIFADDEQQDIQQDGDTQSADTGEQEIAPTGDTDTDHSEHSETGAIEPPVSWTAEAKENFAKLPLELQQYVATRESEREKFIATQGQTTAEERQRLQAMQTQFETERAQQADLFNATILQLVPELQRFNGVDWNKLSVEKPAEWAQQFQAYNDLNNRLNAAQGHLANIRAQQAAEGQKHHQNYLNEQKQLLIQKIPEFADPVKGMALREDMTKHLTEFSKEELHSIADHRMLLVARDALLWRKSEAARQAAQAKRVTPAASNVRPLRPAGRQDVSAGDAAQTKQLEALHGKLAKTGSYRDAADLLTASGIFGK